MRNRIHLGVALMLVSGSISCRARTERLMLDVHHLEPGQVKLADVASAHQKDLAVQGEHDVHYRRYWVDEVSGTVFCLVEAPDAEAARDVHREAHGLVADEIHEVVPGILPASATGKHPLFLDTHRLGKGVRAEDVAEAHRKDLAVQGEHGVRFLDYWVDEREGIVCCLAEAPDARAVAETHRQAHGLIPDSIQQVVEGH